MLNPAPSDVPNPARHVVLFAFDNLPLRGLGCYGNLSFETPMFDQLACDGVVFDQCFVTQPGDGKLESPLWTERHREQTDDWPQTLANAGVSVKEFHIDSDAAFQMAGESCLQLITDQLVLPDQSTLTWIQLAGMDETFLANQEWDDVDPLFGPLLTVVAQEVTNANGLLILTASQGDLPAGEPTDDEEDDKGGDGAEQRHPLRDSVFHVPLIVQFPGCHAGSRCRQIVQSIDLRPTLLDWLGFSLEHASDGQSLLPLMVDYFADDIREFAFWGLDEKSAAVRSDDFLLIRQAEGRQNEHQSGSHLGTADTQMLLFLKPDDLRDVHNVAGQYPEVVADLVAELNQRNESPI